MRQQFDSEHLPSLFDDDPCGSIGDRENLVLRLDCPVLQVRPQTICHFSRNEHDLAAFWAEDLLGCNSSKFPVFAEVIAKFGQLSAMRLNRISFPNSSCGTLDRQEDAHTGWENPCKGLTHKID
jgi:hypothetical protein